MVSVEPDTDEPEDVFVLPDNAEGVNLVLLTFCWVSNRKYFLPDAVLSLLLSYLSILFGVVGYSN